MNAKKKAVGANKNRNSSLATKKKKLLSGSKKEAGFLLASVKKREHPLAKTLKTQQKRLNNYKTFINHLLFGDIEDCDITD